MTASKLKRLVTKEQLRKTWSDFWPNAKNQTSSGVDDITPRQFSKNLEVHLNRIYEELRSGKYKFSALYGHPVPKKDAKKKRIICIPTVSDRLVQRLIGAHLSKIAERKGLVNEASFGFIASSKDQQRGVGAARDRAIKLRNKHPWAYKSDIEAFFDRIPRQEIINQTVSVLRAPSFRKLVEGVVSSEIDEIDPAIARIAKENGIVRGEGLRQGMPISPLLSNILLRDFDRKMLAKGFNLVRYADDFIVLCRDREECEAADKYARKLLEPVYLKLPALDLSKSKTFIAAPDQAIDFLGLSLVRVSEGKYELVIGFASFSLGVERVEGLL
jgi:RNA-directed DNA polymerase